MYICIDRESEIEFNVINESCISKFGLRTHIVDTA